jgi:hypothetical protein
MAGSTARVASYDLPTYAENVPVGHMQMTRPSDELVGEGSWGARWTDAFKVYVGYGEDEQKSNLMAKVTIPLFVDVEKDGYTSGEYVDTVVLSLNRRGVENLIELLAKAAQELDV